MNQDPELEAMATVLGALEGLEPPAQARVVKWVTEKLRIGSGFSSDARSPTALPASLAPGLGNVAAFRDFADLFDAARPSTDVERALVAGFWVQFGQGNAEFGSQSINDELKQLGHPVGNITRALSALIDLRPALVQQLRKEGGTKQARKTYRLTSAGRRKVEQMCGEGGNGQEPS
jgi:hypothetical protein